MEQLQSARAKRDRAQFHVEILRADISEAGQGEPYTIPLREEFDDTGTLYLRVDRLTARPEYWGLLVGDALHNFRSALDHGWWQLALRHMPSEPTDKEAKHIQFPILREGGTWDPRNHLQWVGETVTTYVGVLQPDARGYPPDVIHPLVALNRFSNVDKHRNIHPTVERLHTLEFSLSNETGENIPEASIGTFHHFPAAPKVGDDVLTAPPSSVSHRRGMQFDAHQTGFVAIDGKWDLLMVLAGVDQWVGHILDGFAAILAGKTPEPPQVALG